jgi:multiple sugar transport system permease protein
MQASQETLEVVAKPKEVPKRKYKDNKIAFYFLIPFILGKVLFTAIPMLASLYLSFTRYDMFSSPTWIGWSNYISMFQSSQWRDSMWVTIRYVFLGVPLQLMFALAIALLLNKGMRGLGFYRAMYYVPSLLGGSVAISVLWRQLFGGQGLVNQFLGLVGIAGQNWIGSPDYALYTLIILVIWQFGSPMVIFLAGLKQIPAELYEASEIDGATKWKQFIKITLPMMSPIVLFNLIMQIISAFQAFTPAYIVSNGSGGPMNSTMFYTLLLYRRGFNEFNMGFASAMAWFLLVAIATATGIVFATSKRWVFYQE